MQYRIYKPIFLFLFTIAFTTSRSQTIGTFSSVTPGAQTQSLVLPSTHTFQRIIKSGDALNDLTTLGSSLDFTGYVPISGSSRNGYLSISSETAPAKVAIMSVAYNFSTSIWGKSNSGNVPFSTGAGSDLGNVIAFCSGTVTPDNTIMVCEESLVGGDLNGDGYEDIGWIIEIDPVTKTVMNNDPSHTGTDKLWAVGRQQHENVVIKNDESVMYWGADINPNGYMYKFVPAVPGNYTSGILYVLETSSAIGSNPGPWTGTWRIVPNTTQDDRNNTLSRSNDVLSNPDINSNFNGIEDVEIGPDGKIYFAAKGTGRVYRFTDDGLTVSNLEVFVENATYDVDPGPGVSNATWGLGNDNLAFDGEGNLWVLNDGAGNEIFVVGPTHTAATPSVRLFAETPAGSEPTGITFTPDFKFMFISFQHPSGSNTAAQTDAAGASVVFNTHTSVVIARTENLGPLATLPVKFTDFTVKNINKEVQIEWSVSEVQNHSFFIVERSLNGINFEEIHRNTQSLGNGTTQSFNFIDQQPPSSSNVLYYRIKQCDIDGSCHYSETRSLKVLNKKGLSIYPVPAYNIVNISVNADEEAIATILIINKLGQTVRKETKQVFTGANTIPLNIQQLPKGNYTISIDNGKNKLQEKFIKL